MLLMLRGAVVAGMLPMLVSLATTPPVPYDLRTEML
jgi:hypothetical protein